MSEKKKDVTEVCLAIFQLACAYPLRILFGGWVLAKIWIWHVQTVFADAPDLGIAQAVSLRFVLAALLRHERERLVDKEIIAKLPIWGQGLARVAASAVTEFGILCVGWVLYQFISP